MLQASLPVCLLRRPKETTKLRLKGGTNVPFSPGLDHARLVLAPNLKLMGVNLEVKCVKRGFMPEGVWTLEATISSDGIKPIVLDATEASPERIDGVVFGRGDENGGNRLSGSIKQLSEAVSRCLVIVRVDWAPSVKKSQRHARRAARVDDVERRDARRGLWTVPKRPNVDALCSKLVEALKERHTKAGGGVDDQTADQLALCMAFASGAVSLRHCQAFMRWHLETVMHFASRFTGRLSTGRGGRASCWRARPHLVLSISAASRGRLLYKGGGPSCAQPCPVASQPPTR